MDNSRKIYALDDVDSQTRINGLRVSQNIMCGTKDTRNLVAIWNCEDADVITVWYGSFKKFAELYLSAYCYDRGVKTSACEPNLKIYKRTVYFEFMKFYTYFNS